MTRPETCDAAGGAMSLWVNIQGSGYNGIIAAFTPTTSGFRLYVDNGDLW